MCANPSNCRVLTSDRTYNLGVLDGGVPLVGPQEELCYPSGYTPRGFTSSPGREVKKGLSGFMTTNKQTNKNKKWKLRFFRETWGRELVI